jgi:hypothetical protein
MRPYSIVMIGIFGGWTDPFSYATIYSASYGVKKVKRVSKMLTLFTPLRGRYWCTLPQRGGGEFSVRD